MQVKPNAYKLIKKERLNIGMTGSELARRIGLTPQHFWRIENNKNKFTLELAFKIAKALNVSIKKFTQKLN